MNLFLLEKKREKDFITLLRSQYLDSVTARKEADSKDKEIPGDCRKKVPPAIACHHLFIKEMPLRYIIFIFSSIMIQMSSRTTSTCFFFSGKLFF